MKANNSNNNLTLITFGFIFFGWGLLTTINGGLITHLNNILQLNVFQKSIISYTFFGTYLIVSLIFFLVSLKNDLLQIVGYKYLTISGLTIAAIGAYLIYPASAYLSFPIFMFALMVLASGITILQIAANTYIVNLGDPKFGANRLVSVQTFNAFGASLGPMVGTWLIIKTLDISADDLSLLQPEQLLSFRQIQGISIQLPYWTIATSLFILAAIVFFLPMPDISPNKKLPEKLDVASQNNLLFASLGIFACVGTEVTLGANLGNIIDQQYTHLSGDRSFLITTYWMLAMAGRFIGSLLLQVTNPGKLISMSGIGAIIFLIYGMLGEGNFSLYALVGIGLFHSIMFPAIFASGIHKLGGYSGKGASILIMAIVGGAIIPALYNILVPFTGLKPALIIIGACYVCVALYGKHFQKFDGLSKPYQNPE
jgi:MFS transporter, FHS family, L-fucose permease